MPKVVERGNNVNFTNSKCFVRDGKQRLIAVGLKQDGLYTLSTSEVQVNLARDQANSFSDEDLWYIIGLVILV